MISRRALLRAGAAAAVFPWLRSARADQRPTTPLVLLMQTNGTHQSAFWPAGSALASTPLLAPLVDVPRLKERMTLVRGLTDHTQAMGNEHDVGFTGLWSGRPTVGTFTDPWGDGPSIDQVLRATLPLAEPFPTLNTAVLASTAPLFKAHRWSFSYVGSRLQVPAEIDPWKLYATFFAPSLGGAASLERLKERRSVLDFVRQDLTALRSRAPAEERIKLDAHETALRSHELRLERLAARGPQPARCTVRAPGTPIDLLDEANVPELISLMFDFIALAISCGLTRIVTFQFGQCGERWRFPWLGINENSHDDIAHRDDGTNPAITAKSVKINLWYAQQVAYLAKAMDAMPGTTGSLLDDSLVVWGNEMATGPHGMDDIPAVLLGRAGGQLSGDRYVNRGPQSTRRLATSVLRLMGVPAAGFGDQPHCGPLVGLVEPRSTTW